MWHISWSPDTTYLVLWIRLHTDTAYLHYEDGAFVGPNQNITKTTITLYFDLDWEWLTDGAKVGAGPKVSQSKMRSGWPDKTQQTNSIDLTRLNLKGENNSWPDPTDIRVRLGEDRLRLSLPEFWLGLWVVVHFTGALADKDVNGTPLLAYPKANDAMTLVGV